MEIVLHNHFFVHAQEKLEESLLIQEMACLRNDFSTVMSQCLKNQINIINFAAKIVQMNE